MEGSNLSGRTHPAAATRPLLCIWAALFGLASACGGPPAPEPADPAEGRDRVVRTPGARPASPRPSDRRTLVLLGTTDVHGYLYPYDYYRGRETAYGLARLKPLVDSVRAAHPGRAYLFDSGDLLQGNPLPFVYATERPDRPNPVIRAMNLLAYDAAAVGNHEFNYGIDHLDRAVGQAGFPFVSANTFLHGTDEYAYGPYALIPHVVAEGDTILIGVTGNTPPGVHVWDRDNVDGRLEFRDVVRSLRPVVRELRDRGADLVAVLSHGGLEGTSYDTAATGLPPENAAARTAREVPGIDVIFLGHTHRERADTLIDGVLMTQAGHWARSLAAATVELERRAPNEWTVAAKRGVLLRPDPARADTALLDSLRWQHERAVAYVNSVIGRSSEHMAAREARVHDAPILDFVNEVQRRAAGAELSATAAFSLDAAIPAGEVTVADVAGLYIYDNTLKAVRITGAELRAFLEKSAEYYCGWPASGTAACRTVTDFDVPGYNFDVVSGVDYTIDLTRPVGERIVELTHRRAPVRPDDVFTLALNNYRQAGGGGFAMLADLPVVHDRQEDIRALLIAEVRRRGTIRPADYSRENWRIVPDEAARSALEEQLERRRGTDEDAADSASTPLRLRVLATADLHGRLEPRRFDWTAGRDVGGAATLAAYLAAERAGYAGPTVLVDGGDIFQGSPVSNLTEGRATVDVLNAAGYAAAALGNHEFDWGTEVLRDRLRQADFPFLAANVFVAGADTAPDWVRPWVLVEPENGPTVGIIGLALPSTPAQTKSENVAGLEFRRMADAVDRWVPALRARGADIVIVVAHAGAICSSAGPDAPAAVRTDPSTGRDDARGAADAGAAACDGDLVELTRAVQHAPDLIVGGHTHRTVYRRIHGIPVVQAAAYGTRYAVADVTVERGGPAHRARAHVWIRGVPVTFAGRVEADSAVAAILDRYRAEVGGTVDAVVATLAEPLPKRRGEYALGRLIADAQRWAANAHVAIMNNGGIRRGLDAGPVTWGELYELQPFDNELVRLHVTGAQLRSAIERLLSDDGPDAHISGAVVWYDPERRRGRRVVSLELQGGEPVYDDAVYSVAVNDYLADPDRPGTAFRHALARERTGIVDLEALIDYLAHRPEPVHAPDEDRFRTAVEAPSPSADPGESP